MLYAPDQAVLSMRAVSSAAVNEHIQPQTLLALAFETLRWWQESCRAVVALLTDVPSCSFACTHVLGALV